MGWISEYIGLSAAVASGGALCLVAYAWCMRSRRAVARILEVDPVLTRQEARA
jgi:hypothetical protein